MRWAILLVLVLIFLAGCTTPLQDPKTQAILSSDPLVYVPDARVESRELQGDTELIRFRTYRSRTLAELEEDLKAGFAASRLQLKCSELMGVPLGGEPYLKIRLAVNRERDLTLRITPLDGDWLFGHSLFQAELKRPPAQSTFLSCPMD